MLRVSFPEHRRHFLSDEKKKLLVPGEFAVIYSNRYRRIRLNHSLTHTKFAVMHNNQNGIAGNKL